MIDVTFVFRNKKWIRLWFWRGTWIDGGKFVLDCLKNGKDEIISWGNYDKGVNITRRMLFEDVCDFYCKNVKLSEDENKISKRVDLMIKVEYDKNEKEYLMVIDEHSNWKKNGGSSKEWLGLK